MVEGDGCSHNVVSKIHFKSMSAVQRAKEPTFNDGSNQGKVIKKLQVIAVDLRWWREMDVSILSAKRTFKAMSEACERKELTFNDGSNQGKVIKKLQAFAVEFVMVEGDGFEPS